MQHNIKKIKEILVPYTAEENAELSGGETPCRRCHRAGRRRARRAPRRRTRRTRRRCRSARRRRKRKDEPP